MGQLTSSETHNLGIESSNGKGTLVGLMEIFD